MKCCSNCTNGPKLKFIKTKNANQQTRKTSNIKEIIHDFLGSRTSYQQTQKRFATQTELMKINP